VTCTEWDGDGHVNDILFGRLHGSEVGLIYNGN
jgi:hypothetical protein